MSLLGFCEWLGNTHGSTALHESIYMFPLVESAHVWGLTLFVGLAMMLDLRLLNWTMRRVPMSEVARQLLPWMIAGFAVMVVSGVLTFYARPVHYFQSIFFRIKLFLLVLAGLNAWVFHSSIWRTVAKWDCDPVTPKRARFAAAASLALWALIIIMGRSMAYDWFDCDRQPQRAIINWIEACQEAT